MVRVRVRVRVGVGVRVVVRLKVGIRVRLRVIYRIVSRCPTGPLVLPYRLTGILFTKTFLTLFQVIGHTTIDLEDRWFHPMWQQLGREEYGNSNIVSHNQSATVTVPAIRSFKTGQPKSSELVVVSQLDLFLFILSLTIHVRLEIRVSDRCVSAALAG